MQVQCAAVVAGLILCLSVVARAEYEYDYSYGYDGYDFYDGEDDFATGDSFGLGGVSPGSQDDEYYDEYNYYGDDEMEYYDYYGTYTNDYPGYEDYYTEEYDFFEECFFDASGKPVLANNTASCDIKISGIDKQAAKLNGGLDGTYQLTSCYNGKPMYKRKNSPAGEERVLWYSSTFGDWDVSKGTDPNEAEILMYGGEMEHASVPLFVSSWHLGGDLKTDSLSGEEDYLPVNVKVACADGSKYDKPELTTGRTGGPLLTPEEMEAKYMIIYSKYGRASEPSPTINFTFVVLLVMTGLTIVLAIPYFLLRKKGAKGGSGTSLSTSFAQMLSQSKKKQSGHVN